jgi:ribulose kinase
MAAAEEYYVGVDVGTGSVRASLVKPDGTIIASSTQDILTFRDPDDYRIFEQSTANIWSAISTAIQSIVAEAKIRPDTVKGLGFDATCSLAVCDLDGKPVVITKGDQLGQHGERDVILWADHRAEEEANIINATGSIVLDYVGGTMSVCPFFSARCYSLYDTCSSRWKYPRSSGSRNT